MTMNSITYAGHSAVFIQTEKGSIAIDPWINGNPSCPENFEIPSDTNLILLSHGHYDHAGDAVLLAKQFGATVAATFELANIMAKEGVPEQNVIAMNRGGAKKINGVTCALTSAFHSSSYESARNGTLYAGEACGIIVSDGQKTIYHAGDTALFSDMQLIKERFHPDIAMLPIGDHFTMGPEEAAQAAKLIGCDTAIPIHYKTFDILTGTIEAFRKACSALSIEVIELTPGQTIDL